MDNRNDSDNYQSSLADPLNQDSYNIVVVSFFSVILLTGFSGNLMVLGTILKWTKLRNSCGLFIANISFADLGVALVAAPQRIADCYIRGWPLGEILCKFLTPLQELMVCVSVVTHSTIALERYRATITPFKPKLNASKTRVVIVGIWCVCYVFGCLPLTIPLKLQSFNGTLWCVPEWSVPYRRAYEIYLVTVFIVAQLIIQSFAYISIVRTLRTKNDVIAVVAAHTENLKKGASFDSSSVGFSARTKRKEKLSKMLLVLVVVFQICHLPRGITMLIREFIDHGTMNPSFEYIDLIALALFYFKHVINPFILYGMSADFRKGFVKVFSCFCICVCSGCVKRNRDEKFSFCSAVKKTKRVVDEPEKNEIEEPV